MRVHVPWRRGRVVALAATLGLLASACAESDGSAAAGEELAVVATTSILGDIVGELVADDGEVTVLMEGGVDPHAYQPSAADAALLREADLVVANGLQLEENLVDSLAAAEQDGTRVVAVGEHLDPIGFEEAAADHDDEGDGHDDEDDAGDDEDDAGDGHDDDADDHDEEDDAHGPEDPHVWFDPIRMADGVELLAAELAAVSTSIDAQEWDARAEAYNERLLTVHEELEELFATIPESRRQLVTNHDSLGYLADRYGFEVIGTVIPGSSTQAETDARGFAELIETVEDAGVPAVFADTTDATALADQLANEVADRGAPGFEVVRLHTGALGDEGSGAETYLELLRTNGRLIVDALA